MLTARSDDYLDLEGNAAYEDRIFEKEISEIRVRKNYRAERSKTNARRTRPISQMIDRFLAALTNCQDIKKIEKKGDKRTSSRDHSIKITPTPEGLILSILTRYVKYTYLLVTSRPDEAKQFVTNTWVAVRT